MSFENQMDESRAAQANCLPEPAKCAWWFIEAAVRRARTEGRDSDAFAWIALQAWIVSVELMRTGPA
jgi:hypothetical protein